MADILNKLNSANYVTVKVTDDPITNGNNLLAAYALAKSINPNGIVKSASNRLDIILPVAIYDLGIQSLTLDTQYIDLIGSTIDRNNHYIKSNVGVANRGVIIQTANDLKLYNLTIQNTNTTYRVTFNNTDPAAYFPNTNLNLTYIENVRFLSNDAPLPPTPPFTRLGSYSMRTNIIYSGTFINCVGGERSFGGGSVNGSPGGVASGTFTDCIGGESSFGANNAIASGTFTNCIGGNYSFAGVGSIASGTFTDCTGGQYSFGGAGTASGNFTNCTGGERSFGGIGGTASGNFTNCTGGERSFGGGAGGGDGVSSGNFINCIGGDFSFGGANGKSIGKYSNCIGGINSWNL